MAHTLSFIPRILVAPWQQRRNQNRLGIIALIVGLCLLLPWVVLAWFASGVGWMRSLLTFVMPLTLLASVLALVAGWVLFVVNVLEQNHPVLARVVPGHVARLRVALLLVWMLAVAYVSWVAIHMGYAARLPLTIIAAHVAVVFALFAAAMRWRVLWWLACAVTYGATRTTAGPWLQGVALAVVHAGHALGAAGLVASATLVAALPQSGGPRHVRAHATRKNRNLLFQSLATGVQPLTATPAPWSRTTRITGRFYGWWMQRLLVRHGSSPLARLSLGFGPALHWTTLMGGTFVALAIVGLVMTLIGLSPLSGLLPAVLAGLSLGLMYGFVERVLQSPARLHQRAREQALLVLLPGVPRGRALNRWLSLSLSLQFALSWALGGVSVAVLVALVERFSPGITKDMFVDGRGALAVGTIPLVAFLWRPWAGMAAPTPLRALASALIGILLAGAAYAVDEASECGYITLGALAALLSLAWLGFRWHRMATEQTAFPIGRLHL